MGTSVVANGFNADGTLNVGSTGSVTERTITVAVGGTKTVTADGYYNGSYATGVYYNRYGVCSRHCGCR